MTVLIQVMRRSVRWGQKEQGTLSEAASGANEKG
jgi:hypothetical protein